jgi:hypothetical protein
MKSGKGTAFVNKILKKKWQARDHEIHKLKIKEAQPITDVREPISFKFPLL